MFPLKTAIANARTENQKIVTEKEDVYHLKFFMKD